MEKTALVTGAGRGIGKAIAIALAKEGMNVVVNYNGSADKAEETAAAIRELGVKAKTVKCNVADFDECKKMFFEDAKIASKELELVLTGRECGLEERAPMCGIPFHAAASYISKLVNKGYIYCIS